MLKGGKDDFLFLAFTQLYHLLVHSHASYQISSRAVRYMDCKLFGNHDNNGHDHGHHHITILETIEVPFGLGLPGEEGFTKLLVYARMGKGC
jgi:hypothetical protein